jgi:hypothetical protein
VSPTGDKLAFRRHGCLSGKVFRRRQPGRLRRRVRLDPDGVAGYFPARRLWGLFASAPHDDQPSDSPIIHAGWNLSSEGSRMNDLTTDRDLDHVNPAPAQPPDHDDGGDWRDAWTDVGGQG